MTYKYSLDGDLSQGDILRNVGLILNVNDPETNAPKYGNSHIIVLSRNCEIDKPIKASNGTNSILVARLVRLASINYSLQGTIRQNHVLNAFCLPSNNSYIEDCYIDWRTLQSVEKSNIKNLRSVSEHYICSLETQVIQNCFESLFIFLTKPEDP